MAQVQCQIEIPKVDGSDQLTVGHVFYFNCDGDWPALNKESLELRLEEADKYKLKLLDFEFTSKTSAKLTVTSYKAGTHQLKAVQMVDAENSVVLNELQFHVQSVLNPQEPEAEPYGPMGPLNIGLPLWFPLAILLVLFALIGLFGYRWKLRREKKKLLAEMRVNESAQDPYFQFYQSLRKIQRGFSGAELPASELQAHYESLNQAYKIYLARQFEVPTLKWSERKILSDLKKNHRAFYQEYRLEVRKALAELARAGKISDKLSAKDLEQLLALLRRQVDSINQFLKGKRK